MTTEADLAQAKAEATIARERLLGSAHTLQARLKPSALAENAWEGVRDSGEAAAQSAVAAVSRRPVAAGAAALGVVALLARKPIAKLFSRLRGKKN